jgi:hypothetical protein
MNERSMWLAVFGHYDSRGGTAAVELAELTEAALADAKRAYDLHFFGIEQPEDPIQSTVYGMEARKADQIVHSMIYGTSTPGAEDFMYVAQLHYPDPATWPADFKLDGELTIDGTGVSDVLIDNVHIEDGDRVGPSQSWNWNDPPIQLELVIFDRPNFDDIRTREDRLEEAFLKMMDTANPPDPADPFKRNIVNGSTSYDTDDIRAIRATWRQKQGELEAEREARITQHSKVLKQPRTTRWDDDAFGFVVLTREGIAAIEKAQGDATD